MTTRMRTPVDELGSMTMRRNQLLQRQLEILIEESRGTDTDLTLLEPAGLYADTDEQVDGEITRLQATFWQRVKENGLGPAQQLKVGAVVAKLFSGTVKAIGLGGELIFDFQGMPVSQHATALNHEANALVTSELGKCTSLPGLPFFAISDAMRTLARAQVTPYFCIGRDLEDKTFEDAFRPRFVANPKFYQARQQHIDN